MAARDAGLDAIAVTDHNTAAGIEPLQHAAASMPDAPVVFPGVELTISDGTHLLLILDPSATKQHVEEILSVAQIPVDDRGKRDARSTLNAEQVFTVATARGAVVIGAHVNGPAGLLAHIGLQRIRELSHEGLAAVEVDPSQACDSSWLDGSRPEIARVHPIVWGSDAHRHSMIGERATWIKMSRPNVEGLRLALMDGKDSLSPVGREETPTRNQHAGHAIESIEIARAKYFGRPEPVKISFNPWLNAIVGGRGTGKSTLVDMNRAVLRRGHELEAGATSSLGESFNKRMSAQAHRDDEGLLTTDTEIKVVYRKDGERFRLTWEAGKGSARVARIAPDADVPEEGDIAERFPVRIYSQKQLFDLARRPDALLVVIDDSNEVRGAELARQRREAEATYLARCAEARALRARAADLPAREASLADVRRKIAVLEQGGNAETLNEYRRRQVLESARVERDGRLQGLLDELTASVDRLVLPDLPNEPQDQPDAATEALRRSHDSHQELVSSIRQEVTTRLQDLKSQLLILATGDDSKQWSSAVAAANEAYEALLSVFRASGITDPDEYRSLLARAAAIEREIGELRAVTSAATEKDAHIASDLDLSRRVRRELSVRRRAFAEKTSSSLVRVTVSPAASHARLEDSLRETLGIERFESDYSVLAQRIRGTGNGEWDSSALDELVGEGRKFSADPELKWPCQDWRFENALRRVPPERWDRLALYWPDDTIEVAFKDSRDGSGQWRALSSGSPGQQTAALLAFVLGYGSEPILLDQPEDDLDNTLIYDLLVTRVRETKWTRQVIVVTHNPNIVVHGDAELVISLESRSGQSRIACAGGLQEVAVRDEVCRVMEGGRKAFADRYRRIMNHHAQRL